MRQHKHNQWHVSFTHSTAHSKYTHFGPDRPRPHGMAGYSGGWIPLLKSDEEEFVKNFEELLKRYKIEYMFV